MSVGKHRPLPSPLFFFFGVCVFLFLSHTWSVINMYNDF